MKRWNTEIVLGVTLLSLSVVFYIIHYAIFRDAHHIFIFLIGDIAFVFVEVFLVTLIIQRVLDDRDKKVRIKKLNMVIGAFFSEIGTNLLKLLSLWDPNRQILKKRLIVGDVWTHQEFLDVIEWLKGYEYKIDIGKVEWDRLRESLLSQKSFLLRLLENPNLLEHDLFTDLLQAIFHLTEELEARVDLTGVPETDLLHLASDIKRVYKQLGGQWLSYMEHLKENYPYYFSFALRINPFDEKASPVVLK